MKSMGIFEAKNRLSDLCVEVARHGDPLVVTHHGKPLVRIVPYETESAGQSVWDSVKECRAKYGPIQEELELLERKVSTNRPDPFS